MNNQRFVKGAFLTALLGLIALLGYEYSAVVQRADAIPAFARKYDFKCNVCHVPGFPKLNDFGNLFRDRGYQLGSDADLPEYEGIMMGFWPVSFRTTVGNQVGSLHGGSAGNISTNAVGFTGLDILSFGTLARDIAFRIVLTGTATGEVGFASGAEDLESAAVKLMRLEKYVGIKSAPGDYLVNFLIGKHELDVPFSEKREPSLNTIITMYHYTPGVPYLTGTIGSGNLLTGGYLNPNQFGIGDNQPGIELTGLKKTKWSGGWFRYTLDGVFNSGQTSSPAFTSAQCPASPSGAPATTCGTSGGKGVSFYGHVTQSFGGYGIVTGHRIGLLYLYQQVPTLANQVQAAGAGGDLFARKAVGVDFSTTYNGEWNLFGAWMYNHYDAGLFAPFATGNGIGTPTGVPVGQAQSAQFSSGFIELNYYPALLPFFNDPDWFFEYRWDFVQNSQQGFSGFSANFNNVNSHTGVIRKFLHQSKRTDIALHIEYNWYTVTGVVNDGSNLIGQTIFTGLDFAF